MRKSGKKTKKISGRKRRDSMAAGPSQLEVEFLRQIKQRLEAYLRAKKLNTIRGFEIGFTGNGYRGRMSVQ